MLDQLPPQTVPVAVGLIAIVASYFSGKYREGKKKLAQLETDLRQLLRDQDIFPSPKVRRETSSFVEESLKENIDGYDGGSVPFNVYTSDGTYYLPANKSTMTEAKQFNPFEYLPYRPERFDCEDYASAYMTFAAFLFGTNGVGTIYDFGAGHAYNIILYSDGSIELYEPQTGQVVEPGSEDKYSLESGMIVF